MEDPISKERKCLLPKDIGTDFTYKRQIVWPNAIGFLVLHLLALYGLYRVPFCFFYTLAWSTAVGVISGLGVTLGAHRLYTHRAFKATFPVRLMVLLLHTIAGQNCMYVWVRDHRQHHKYSDTDADPHNINRGFFFAHIGWLMSRKHPAVISKGKAIDLSDLEADSLIMFQKEFYKLLYTVFALALPVMVPVIFWNESYLNALFVSFFARCIILLNITWSINSVTHLYGTKPYDKNIFPVENFLVSILALGEGWHNYHHAFPSDYRAAEFGVRYSLTTLVIDILSYFNLVHDLKEAKTESVNFKIIKKGDGTHEHYNDMCEEKNKIEDSIKVEEVTDIVEEVQYDDDDDALEEESPQSSSLPVDILRYSVFWPET